MPRTVADTTVLVAAAIAPRGTCGRLVDAAIEGTWQVVASSRLIAELTLVLGREEFCRWLTCGEADRFVADVQVLADIVADSAPAPETGDRRP